MKTRTIKKIIFTTVLVFTGMLSYAQMMGPGDPGGGPSGGDPPVGGDAPVSGGVIILFTLGTAYGAKKVVDLLRDQQHNL